MATTKIVEQFWLVSQKANNNYNDGGSRQAAIGLNWGKVITHMENLLGKPYIDVRINSFIVPYTSSLIASNIMYSYTMREHKRRFGHRIPWYIYYARPVQLLYDTRIRYDHKRSIVVVIKYIPQGQCNPFSGSSK